MNEKSSVRIGPGASSLILIFVMLSLSVLAMLSLTSAYNDRQMGLRSVQVTEEIYALNEQAEQTRADLSQILLQCQERAAGAEEYEALVQEALASADGLHDGVREGLYIEGDSVCWQEGDGVYTLDCAIRLGTAALPGTDGEDAGKEAGVGTWTRHRLIVDRAQMEDEWDEWN